MSRMHHAVASLALAALALPSVLWGQQADPMQNQAPPAATETVPPVRQQAPRENPAVLEDQARRAYEAGEYLQFYIASLKLHNQLPFVPAYMYDLVRACALLDKRSTAYSYMFKMQQQGLSYDFNETEDTLGIRDTEAYSYINNLMIDAAKPAGDGAVALSLPGNPADYRGMAWDGSRNRFLVGTVQDGRLLAVDADGQIEELLRANDTNGLKSIAGLAVDAAQNRLWISSAATPLFAGYTTADRNRSALLELNLETLEVLGTYYLPVDALDHVLGDLALTRDGHVYIIDTLFPVIYRKRPQVQRIEAFVASRDLVGFTDIAVTPDNSRLFVADPVMGVFVVDPIAEQTNMLGGLENLNLAGIEGIEYANGHLFIVQSGIQPQRIMRLELDGNGTGVAAVSPMAIELDGFDWPGNATIHEGSLYYFGNRGAVESETATVMATPLDAGASIKGPDIEDLKRAIQSSAE